jgi:repressor LexA
MPTSHPDYPDLTLRQGEMLDAIKAYIAEYNWAPSVRKIGELVGLKSTSSVVAQLDNLSHKGYIYRAAGEPRALALADRTQPA